MKIRGKLFSLVGVQLLGVIILIAVGFFSFSNIKEQNKTIEKIQEDQQSIISADRDAYQAFVDGLKSATETDKEKLDKFKADLDQNLDQTWNRINDPSANFTDEMLGTFNEFKTKYDEWSVLSKEMMSIDIADAENRQKRVGVISECSAAFSEMRDDIDMLGEKLNKRYGDGTSEDATKITKAISLILNADRDAYQAHVAQLDAMTVKTRENFDRALADGQENIQQVIDRLTGASKIFTADEMTLFSNFKTHFEDWRGKSTATFDITSELLKNSVLRRELAQKAEDSFKVMRKSIDQLTNKQEELAKSTLVEVENGMNSAVTFFIVTGILIFVIAVAIGLYLTTDFVRCIRCVTDHLDGYSKGRTTIIDMWNDFITNNLYKRRDEFNTMTIALGNLRRYVNSKAEIASSMAAGDLTSEVKLASGDDKLGLAFEKMLEDLNEVIRQISKRQTRSAPVQVRSATLRSHFRRAQQRPPLPLKR